MGLEQIRWNNAEVHVWSDSSYVVKALNEGWLDKWKAIGFKGKKNVDLWLRFDAVYKRHRVAFHWIKGHAGHPENERCDRLAVAAEKVQAAKALEEAYQSERDAELARAVAAYHQPSLPEDSGYLAENTQLL